MVTPYADEIIVIKCPDRPDGAGRIFEFQRSILRRSPTFARFFASDYYLHGCEMRLTFVVDPAICLEFAYRYLKEGPDIFHETALRVSLHMRFRVFERPIVLARLYSLAQKLALPGLKDMAFVLLMGWNDLIDPNHCITLSSLIFAHDGVFDRKLKEWCIYHITKKAKELKWTRTWQKVLQKSDHELKEKWTEILKELEPRLDPVEEAREDATKDNNTTNTAGPDSTPHSHTSAKSQEESFQDTIDEVRREYQSGTESDEEWRLTEALAAALKKPNDCKIRQLLGPIEKSPSEKLKRLLHSPSSIFSPGVDKARLVMGFPGTVEPMERTSISSYPTPEPTPTKPAKTTKLWTAR